MDLKGREYINYSTKHDQPNENGLTEYHNNQLNARPFPFIYTNFDPFVLSCLYSMCKLDHLHYRTHLNQNEINNCPLQQNIG